MKKIFKVAIIIILTIAIIRVERDFKSKDEFFIQTIEYNPLNPTLEKDLEPILKGLVGKNINKIDIGSLENKLEKDIRVEKARIEKIGYNKLKVSLEEKVGKYYIQYKNKIFLCDELGNVFGRFSEYPRGDFPIIILNSEEDLLKEIFLLKLLEELNFLSEISQIEIVDENLILLTLINGVEIKTLEEIEKDRYFKVITLYKKLQKEREIEYIDMRFNDVFIKEKEGKNGK